MPRSVGEARRFVRRALSRGRLEDDVVAVAELLTSELVTNVLLHAESPAELAVRLRPAAIRVEVIDESPASPVPRPLDEESSSGRGMVIVDALSSEWGVELVPDDGKRVWFELAC